MSNKDEAFECFKRYKAEVENQKGRKIKCLRSDRGGEYFSHELIFFVKSMVLYIKELHPIHHNKMAWQKGKIGHSLK